MWELVCFQIDSYILKAQKFLKKMFVLQAFMCFLSVCFCILFSTFEKRAVELLTLCYEEAPESATEAIATRMPLWGNQRLISLAANGRSRNFVSHNCCQAYLKEIWHGMVLFSFVLNLVFIICNFNHKTSDL